MGVLMIEQQFDVVVVGASLAGCTAAMLYARDGLSVALVERDDDPNAYKQMCTHFIQGSATPTLRRLGLTTPIEAVGGVRNAVNMWTQWGWIIEPDLRDNSGERLFGYSLRREVLDPMLRALATATPGVQTFFGYAARELVRKNGRVAGVNVHHDATILSLCARLVVAADGRNSRLAKLAQVPTTSSPNIRGGITALYRNVQLKCGQVSQMWFKGTHVAYVFPNDDNITLVTVMPPRHELAEIGENPRAWLEAYIRALPDGLDLSSAEPLGNCFQLKDYPNLSRPVIASGMALIGDAAVSMDPLYGVGCGWAFQTAEWLVDSTVDALKRRTDLDAPLRNYAKVHAKKLAGHQFVIKDFSKRNRFNLIERVMFRAATLDQGAAKHVYRFGMRLSSLREFLAPGAIFRALWINLFGGADSSRPRTHRTPPPMGTGA